MKFNSILKKLDWEFSKVPPKSTVTFLNPYSYYLTRNLKKLDDIDFIGIDGGLLKFIINLFFNFDIERISFDNSSLAPKLYHHCINENHSIYFIGSTSPNIQGFINVLKAEVSNLNIVGYRHGYFESITQKEEVLKKIIKLNPNYVIVGMGTPFQENFILDLNQAGYEGIAFTCGGYFHQTTKGFNYYPYFFDKYNLRWFYRIIDEPKLIKRYLVFYPQSLFFIFLDLLRYKLLSSCSVNIDKEK